SAGSPVAWRGDAPRTRARRCSAAYSQRSWPSRSTTASDPPSPPPPCPTAPNSGRARPTSGLVRPRRCDPQDPDPVVVHLELDLHQPRRQLAIEADQAPARADEVGLAEGAGAKLLPRIFKEVLDLLHVELLLIKSAAV